jgi:hypothetical protein
MTKLKNDFYLASTTMVKCEHGFPPERSISSPPRLSLPVCLGNVVNEIRGLVRSRGGAVVVKHRLAREEAQRHTPALHAHVQ